jgi:hypothetical protein
VDCGVSWYIIVVFVHKRTTTRVSIYLTCGVTSQRPAVRILCASVCVSDPFSCDYEHKYVPKAERRTKLRKTKKKKQINTNSSRYGISSAPFLNICHFVLTCLWKGYRVSLSMRHYAPASWYSSSRVFLEKLFVSQHWDRCTPATPPHTSNAR